MAATKYTKINLPKPLAAKVSKVAKAERRSLSAQVRYWVEKALADGEGTRD